jgi:hypothetical protein
MVASGIKGLKKSYSIWLPQAARDLGKLKLAAKVWAMLNAKQKEKVSQSGRC